MRDESDKHIKLKGAYLNVPVSKELNKSNEAQQFYKIGLKPADVAILHPSFLCPALKKKGEALHFIILVDKTFHNTFEKSEGKSDKKAGPVLGAIVNRYLKMVAWSEVDKAKPASEPLFDSNDKAKENIEVHYLWKLSELDDNILLNKDEKPFAQIHPEVLKLYQDKKLAYGFEIIINNLAEDTPGLYDLSWMAYVKKDETEEKKVGYFCEWQDKIIGDYNTVYRQGFHPLKCDVSANDEPCFEETETEIQSYHPVYISDKASLDIGHLSDVHISSRQQVFAKSHARLIDIVEGGDESQASEKIGQLVNVSFAVLKDLMNQMGRETDLLVFTGDLIDYNRNYNPHNSRKPLDQLKKSADIWQALDLKNLKDKQQYTLGIDNLTLYALFKWYYKTYKKPIMLISGNHEAYTVPYGISPRIKLKRSMNSTYNPLGKMTVDDVIEKSIKQAEADQKEKEEKGPDIYDSRANEGIPADHNLTIPEAILMYGPDYAKVVMGASYDYGNERNFRPENLAWFYHIFTPLSSYVLTYGEQCFMGLGWGNDEAFVAKAVVLEQGSWTKGGGFLPRSTQGVSDSQLKLVEAGLKEGKPNNLLCSHFTYVNYNTKETISKEGEVNYNDTTGILGKYDYGTFEENRKTIYKKLAVDDKRKNKKDSDDNKIQYTLSGHSHRSGLYHITNGDNSFIRSNMDVQGQASRNFKFSPRQGCRILVAACGGPIAVQNHNHELFNWGMDYPSGNVIKADGSISIKVSKVKQAQPRLAVALDYADIFLREEGKGKNKAGLLKTFISIRDDGPFTLDINPDAKLPVADLFSAMELCIYTDEKLLSIKGSATINPQGKGEFMPAGMFDTVLKKATERSRMGFIKLTLKPSSHEHLRHYNTGSEWIYPIQLYSRKKLAEQELEKLVKQVKAKGRKLPVGYAERRRKQIKKIEGYVTDRHAKFGEVPDLDWYKKKFAHEYT